MSHNAYIRAEIQRLRNKISECESAKQNLQTVKNECVNKKEDWQYSFNGLANNQKLANVVKTDSFEGEMADALKSKVSEAMTDISTGISRTGNLESALGSQIKELENKISDFEDDISRLERQLD